MLSIMNCKIEEDITIKKITNIQKKNKKISYNLAVIITGNVCINRFLI